jgi:hypothetical protein
MLLRRNLTEDQRGAFIAAAVENANARLHQAESEGRLFICIGQGPASDAVAAAVCERFPQASMALSSDSNLVFLREVEGVLLPAAAEQMIKGRGDCAAAARRVLTRVDVSWMALPTQSAVSA